MKKLNAIIPPIAVKKTFGLKFLYVFGIILQLDEPKSFNFGSVEEIRATTICRNSADVVGGGCLLMLGVMKKFGVNEITAVPPIAYIFKSAAEKSPYAVNFSSMIF